MRRKCFGNAKQILVSELVLAENANQEDVEKLVENKITMSFEEYKMPTEVEEEIGNNVIKKFIPFDDSANV